MAILTKKQLLEAKKKLKEFNRQNNIVKNKQSKPKLSYEDRKELRKENKTKIIWNIKKGDLVFAENNNSKKEICLVVKDAEETEQYSSNLHYRKNHISVQVIGASGFRWVNTRKIEKID